MARPREFDIDEAIAGAMQVFWTHGYSGASLPDLLDGMSITRGSLYKAFTDKKTVFIEALKRYDAEAVSSAVELLTDETKPNGLERIETLFANALATAERGDARGCLLCNAAAGAASEDADIAALVHEMLGRMKDGFAAALSDSPGHQALSAEARDALAALLMANYTGLRILARARAPMGAMRAAVQALSDLLRAD